MRRKSYKVYCETQSYHIDPKSFTDHTWEEGGALFGAALNRLRDVFQSFSLLHLVLCLESLDNCILCLTPGVLASYRKVGSQTRRTNILRVPKSVSTAWIVFRKERKTSLVLAKLIYSSFWSLFCHIISYEL